MAAISSTKPRPATESTEQYLMILAHCLEQLDSRRNTNATFEEDLRQLVQKQGSEQNSPTDPLVIHSGRNKLFLNNQHLADLVQAIRHVEQKPLRETVEFLQEVVQKREARGDLWPEGRLQLGIAYATLEEYANARRVLEEVMRICESGGRYMDEQAIAA